MTLMKLLKRLLNYVNYLLLVNILQKTYTELVELQVVMKRLYENGRLNADEKTVALRTQGELAKDAYIMMMML